MIVRRFEDILKELSDDQIELAQKRTLQWYLDQIKKLAREEEEGQTNQSDKNVKEKRNPQQQLSDSTQKYYSSFSPDIYGKVCFFRYDPKLKKTLKY